MLTAPDWTALYEVASAQEGLFSTEQAQTAGYSLPLLTHHCKRGKFRRIRRGVYRIVHFPPGEHEELVVLWLWSKQLGIFSFETALFLHQLSDVLPARVHLTLPTSWKKRRLKIPDDVIPDYEDTADHEKTWFGPIPITSVAKTLNDVARRGISPELLSVATSQAIARGIVDGEELPAVHAALEAFGGIKP